MGSILTKTQNKVIMLALTEQLKRIELVVLDSHD